MAFDIIVFSQDELMAAISAGIKHIALCDNTFHLPANIDIHYTIIGEARIKSEKKDENKPPFYANVENKPLSCESSAISTSFSSFAGSFGASYTTSSSMGAGSYTSSYALLYENNTGSGLILGSGGSYSFGYSYEFGGSYNFGYSYEFGNSYNFGYSYEFGNSYNFGYSYEFGNSYNFGYSYEFGNSYNFGYSYEFGNSYNFGYSYEFGNSYNFGYSYEFGGSYNLGYSFEFSGSYNSILILENGGSYIVGYIGSYSPEFTGSSAGSHYSAGSYDFSDKAAFSGLLKSSAPAMEIKENENSGVVYVNGYGINLI